jgi:hypothetical protein
MFKRLGMGLMDLISPLTANFAMATHGAFTVIRAAMIYVAWTTGTVTVAGAIVFGMVIFYDLEEPYYRYVPSQELLELELSEAIEDLLNGQLKIDITEERMNRLLHAYIVEEINPAYNPYGGCFGEDTGNCDFITINTTGFNNVRLAVKAAWFTLLEDQIILNLSIYQVDETSTPNLLLVDRGINVRMFFTITDNEEYFEAKFDRLQTGFLPLPINFFVNILAPVFENNGIPTTSDGANSLSYDLNDLTVRLDKQKYIDENIDNEVLANYASLVVTENLLQITVDEESKEIRLFVDQERLYTQTSIPLTPGSVELVTALYLQNIIDSGSFSIGDLLN